LRASAAADAAFPFLLIELGATYFFTALVAALLVLASSFLTEEAVD